MYQSTYLGGIGISASASRIKCNQFEKDQTVLVSESNVQTNYFNFDLIQGAYNSAEVLAGINNLTKHVHSALPEFASMRPRLFVKKRSSCPRQSHVRWFLIAPAARYGRKIWKRPA